MYDMKWVINYPYYLVYSINKLHCLLNIVINSKKSHISTWLLYNPHTYGLLATYYLNPNLFNK
jgi:hypothetical protein